MKLFSRPDARSRRCGEAPASRCPSYGSSWSEGRRALAERFPATQHVLVLCGKGNTAVTATSLPAAALRARP